LIPTTVDRVPQNTAAEVNLRIEQETLERLRYLAANPGRISRRLGELDREWSVERALEANAAAAGLAGLFLGATVSKRWYALPLAVSAFLLQHAVQGWCPPLPVLRRLGYRTPHEIETERMALKALRGDFRALETGGETQNHRAGHAISAAQH
jgi:hypothetical protein